jgi:hypothetical protein
MNQSRSRAVTDHQYQRQRAHDGMWPFEGVAHQRRAVQQREGKGDIRQRPLRNLVFFDARPKAHEHRRINRVRNDGARRRRGAARTRSRPEGRRLIMRRVAHVSFIRTVTARLLD